MDARYQKNLGLIGETGQQTLLDSHAAIIGAGGLGGTVFEIFVRYGVGKITIIDFDSFEETNLNRQLLSSVKLLGGKKALAALERANEINPDVKVLAVCEKITDDNAAELIAGADIVCDCLGNIHDRFVLERAAKKLGIPMVHAAVAGSGGQIMTIFPGDKGLSAIYGSEKEAPKSGEELSRGTPPSTVMTIASMQAHETITVLTGIGEPLRNSFMKIDLGKWQTKIYSI